MDRETQHGEEDKCPDSPECTSLGFREDDKESVDPLESPRPLSQDTRNLTASELLLNKLVDAEKCVI